MKDYRNWRPCLRMRDYLPWKRAKAWWRTGNSRMSCTPQKNGDRVWVFETICRQGGRWRTGNSRLSGNPRPSVYMSPTRQKLIWVRTSTLTLSGSIANAWCTLRSSGNLRGSVSISVGQTRSTRALGQASLSPMLEGEGSIPVRDAGFSSVICSTNSREGCRAFPPGTPVCSPSLEYLQNKTSKFCTS